MQDWKQPGTQVDTQLLTATLDTWLCPPVGTQVDAAFAIKRRIKESDPFWGLVALLALLLFHPIANLLLGETSQPKFSNFGF